MKKYVFAMYTSKKSKAMDELDKKKRMDDALLDQMPQDEEMIDLDTFQQATREFGDLMEMKHNLAKALESISQPQTQ